jgi:hypothetical protein
MTKKDARSLNCSILRSFRRCSAIGAPRKSPSRFTEADYAGNRLFDYWILRETSSSNTPGPVTPQLFLFNGTEGKLLRHTIP